MRKKTSRKGGVIGGSGLLLVGFEKAKMKNVNVSCNSRLDYGLLVAEKFAKKGLVATGLASFPVGVRKNTGVWPYAGLSWMTEVMCACCGLIAEPLVWLGLARKTCRSP